jgi:hypothetical protein
MEKTRRARRYKLAISGSKIFGRSKITNGTRLLPTIDGRSVWARRLRDLIELHQHDLGGEDRLSVAENSLIRRASALTVELEHLELKFLDQGEATPQQLNLYGRTSNTLTRVLRELGIRRRPRDITPTPTVDQYLTGEAAE